jgi:hypothetical protein
MIVMMDIQFLTGQQLGNLLMNLFILSILIEVTKELPFIKKLPTMYWSFILTYILFHLVFYVVNNATFSAITEMSIFYNTVAFGFVVNAVYSKIIEATIGKLTDKILNGLGKSDNQNQ